MKVIETNSLDIPFLSFYTVNHSSEKIQLELFDCLRIEKGKSYSPISISNISINSSNFTENERKFIDSLFKVVETNFEIVDLTCFDIPKCTWEKPASHCVMLAIASKSTGKPLAIMVLGASPNLVLG